MRLADPIGDFFVDALVVNLETGGTNLSASLDNLAQLAEGEHEARAAIRADQTRTLPSIACASLLELLQTSRAACFGLGRGLPRCTVEERCGRGRAAVGDEPPGAVGAARP